ncbi:MAG: GNAT family N-acetyltransferase [Arthrobacter sp.]|jgi:putative acetyltransferase|nr:GNAT family N-acetyltransferase [Arthrobacter sp.]
MLITEGGLEAPDVAALLGEHLADMRGTSPAESVHALDLTGLAVPEVTFLAARSRGGELLGVGALAELVLEAAVAPGDGAGGPGGAVESCGEVKSMRTSRAARGHGVASAVLGRIIGLARERDYARLLLETGTDPYFAAARRLYERHGFVECGPFGPYTLDPHSAYFELRL